MEYFNFVGNAKEFKFARYRHQSRTIEHDDYFLDCSMIEQKFIVAQLLHLRETKGHSLENLHESDMKAFNDLKGEVTVKEIVQLLTKVGMATITESHEGAKRVILFWRKSIELGFVQEKK